MDVLRLDIVLFGQCLLRGISVLLRGSWCSVNWFNTHLLRRIFPKLECCTHELTEVTHIRHAIFYEIL